MQHYCTKGFFKSGSAARSIEACFPKTRVSRDTEQSKKCLSFFFFTVSTVAFSATVFFHVCVSISKSRLRVTFIGHVPNIMHLHPKSHNSFHLKDLALRCRVCGRRLPAGKTTLSSRQYTDELLVTHSIDMRLGQNSGIFSWRPKGKCENWPKTGWVMWSLEQR